MYNSVNFRNIGGHNYHALQICAFQASDRLLEERAARLLNTVGATPDPNTLQDETLGEYLRIANRWRDYSYTATGQSLTGIDTNGRVALFDHRNTAFDALNRPSAAST